VIHFDIPGDLESYFQEVGRAGRDGQTAYCVLLYHKSDLSTQQYFIQKAFPDEDELNSLLMALRSHINGNNRLLIRPDDLASEAGIDVERLDVTLHLLERMGFISRSYNFTLMANLLLNHSAGWISQHIDEPKIELFERVVAFSGASDKRGIQLDLLATAKTIGSNPVELDQIFLELSAKGWIVYRPWDRGYILEPLEKLVQNEHAQLQQSDISKLQRSMQRNLRKMVQFAESLGSGDCRRGFVLKHFDEGLSERPTPCCDLCHPNMPLPWQDVPSDEVTDLPAEVNPEYFILRTVDWNDSLAKGEFTKPYTEATLAHILSGNAYAAVLHETDPIRKLRRMRRLEASPYFGILQGIRGGEKNILGLMAKLRDQGFLQYRAIQFTSSGNEVVQYNAPGVSDKGREQIQSGKYLS
jgi:hypothetical protein